MIRESAAHLVLWPVAERRMLHECPTGFGRCRVVVTSPGYGRRRCHDHWNAVNYPPMTAKAKVQRAELRRLAAADAPGPG